MSAAEIIEQIKQLPPEELRVVKQFVNADARGSSSVGVEYINREDLERSAKQIFSEHQELFRKLAQ